MSVEIMNECSQIPLWRPYLSDAEFNAVAKVLKSGRLVSGSIVEEFESRLAARIGIKYAVCVSSGTAALHLGFIALGIGPGDDIIVPAFGHPASANVVGMLGARPVFVDCEQNGFNVDTARIENHITFRTRAIIVVHNFGFPVDITRIQDLSVKYDIPLIEDTACALGASINGANCGTLGKLAAFSFHPRKILTTGEGGTVVTNDHEIVERIRRLRNQGQDPENGGDFDMPGLNYRMTEFQAAMGIAQLDRLDDILQNRAQAAHYYLENLDGMDMLAIFHPGENLKPNFQTFVIRVSPDMRDELILFLKRQNIEAGIGAYSVPHTRYYAEKYDIGKSPFPQSFEAFKSLLSLPIYYGIAEAEQDRVIESLRSYDKSVTDRPRKQAVSTA